MNRRPPGSGSGLEQRQRQPQPQQRKHARDAPPATPSISIAEADEDDGGQEQFPGFANGHVASAAEAEPVKKEVPDAGLRSLDHYKRAMPAWRYHLRQRVLPMVRWETPYLAWFQNALRTPALDSYFAITANLGTHTFFMVGLPILFWCGYPAFGKGLVHILAEGVFFSGWIKDMLSLPRPLSPPLHRITMSGHVSLEYGFPSTHSANAVSVVVYGVLLLRAPDCTLAPTTRIVLELLAYLYAVSIIVGRLYCGMHGFADVIFGGVLGAVISVIEWWYAPNFEAYLHASDWTGPLVIALVLIVLVRVHPEPADDCPCFDDSVAFSGVIIGVEAASWHTGATSFTGPFTGLGWPATIARIVLGVVTIVAWREVAKPTLLKFLPQLFRVIERLGVSLPRRFFVPASEYKNIPNLLKLRTDNVLPTMSDLPRLVKTLRAPTRGRSVSVGPQSAADAYEALAYREKRRRESVGSNGSVRSSHLDLRERFRADGAGVSPTRAPAVNGGGEEAASSSAAGKSTALADYEQQMGQGRVVPSKPRADRSVSPATPMVIEEEEEEGDEELLAGGETEQGDELGEQEMFDRLVKPRVRYDVEVVTKLVVYTGIGWLAVDGIPLLLELIGLGVTQFKAVG